MTTITLIEVEREIRKQTGRIHNSPPVSREDRAGGVVRFTVHADSWILAIDLVPRDPLMDDGRVTIVYEVATTIMLQKHLYSAPEFMSHMARLLSIGFCVDRLQRWSRTITIAETI